MVLGSMDALQAKYVDALNLIEWMLYKQRCRCTWTDHLGTFKSSNGCPTNRPVDALELYIQMDPKADGCAEEPGWCVSMDALQEDKWPHWDLVTMDAQPENLLMHSDSVKLFHYGCPAGKPADTQWLLNFVITNGLVNVIVILLVKF